MANTKQNFDPEWLRLLYLAKQSGATKEDVKHFLHHLPEAKVIKTS